MLFASSYVNELGLSVLSFFAGFGAREILFYFHKARGEPKNTRDFFS